MRKLRIFEHTSLDGVVRHSADENAFPYSNWTVPFRTPAGLAKLCALYGDTYDVLLGAALTIFWAPSGQQLPAARCQTASTLAGSMSRRTVPRG